MPVCRKRESQPSAWEKEEEREVGSIREKKWNNGDYGSGTFCATHYFRESNRRTSLWPDLCKPPLTPKTHTRLSRWVMGLTCLADWLWCVLEKECCVGAWSCLSHQHLCLSSVSLFLAWWRCNKPSLKQPRHFWWNSLHGLPALIGVFRFIRKSSLLPGKKQKTRNKQKQTHKTNKKTEQVFI